MIASLRFKLPEEEDDLNDALKGTHYKNLCDTWYSETLRKHIKRSTPIILESGKAVEIDENLYEILVAIKNELNEHFKEDE